jgi:hypothetical protein
VRLTDFRRNVYSQGGEDGVVGEVFRRLGVGRKLCVEFGAWDSFHLSNTANLWTNGWKGVLIEADRQRYERMVVSTAEYGCVCLNATVKPGALEALLEKVTVTGPIDFLSIDIDGDEYHIMASLTVRPRVICCEYNPTVPYEISLVGVEGSNFGCSARALVELGLKLGYRTVAMTATNCFLVLETECKPLADLETEATALFPRDGLISAAYDGSYVLSRRPQYGMAGPFAGRFAIGEGVLPREGRFVRLARRASNLLGSIRR